MAKRQADLDSGVAAHAGADQGRRSVRPFHRHARRDAPGVGAERQDAWRCTRPRSGSPSTLGIDLTHESSGGGSDANFTGALGIASLDGLGVCGAGAHTLDEHILVESLPERAKLLTGLLMELPDGDFGAFVLPKCPISA